MAGDDADGITTSDTLEAPGAQVPKSSSSSSSSTPAAPDKLQLGDLLYLIKLVEFAAQKGAFPISEFKMIHEVHTRANAFIVAHKQ